MNQWITNSKEEVTFFRGILRLEKRSRVNSSRKAAWRI